MKLRAHPDYKTKYRVKNWASYDRALVQRGDVTVWLSPETIDSWEPASVGHIPHRLKTPRTATMGQALEHLGLPPVHPAGEGCDDEV
jgi:hypothetical protein